MTDKLDRQGRPLSLMEWCKLIEDGDYKIVDRLDEERDGERILISTVWLGLNHNWGPGDPLIFETMIFGGPYHHWQMRWSTEEEALKGHEAVVWAYRENLSPDEAIKHLRETLDDETLSPGHHDMKLEDMQ